MRRTHTREVRIVCFRSMTSRVAGSEAPAALSPLPHDTSIGRSGQQAPRGTRPWVADELRRHPGPRLCTQSPVTHLQCPETDTAMQQNYHRRSALTSLHAYLHVARAATAVQARPVFAAAYWYVRRTCTVLSHAQHMHGQPEPGVNAALLVVSQKPRRALHHTTYLRPHSGQSSSHPWTVCPAFRTCHLGVTVGQ